jgi:hypothetical protein
MHARTRTACALCVVAGLIATLGLGGCVSGSAKVSGSGQKASSAAKPAAPATASGAIAAFKVAKLPVGKVEVYDASTDSNQLLGRPGQYIAKLNFADTRLKQPDGDVLGGSIETFANATDLETRKAYITNLAKQLSLAVEYEYTNGLMLLRLDKGLAPAQADAYNAAFQTLGK